MVAKVLSALDWSIMRISEPPVVMEIKDVDDFGEAVGQ